MLMPGHTVRTYIHTLHYPGLAGTIMHHWHATPHHDAWARDHKPGLMCVEVRLGHVVSYTGSSLIIGTTLHYTSVPRPSTFGSTCHVDRLPWHVGHR